MERGWQAREYTYSTEHPHAVVEVEVAATPVFSATYDANGNMICRAEDGAVFLQTYNVENRLTGVEKRASGTCASYSDPVMKWDFAYDGDGVRTQTLISTWVTDHWVPDAEPTRYFFGGTYEIQPNGTVLKYYSFAGKMVAMREGTTLRYFLTDHPSTGSGQASAASWP